MKKIFSKLDYLTLNVFTTLSELKSGNATANKLNISQSKVTRCINQLREAFNDELFTKEPNGMIPSDVSIRIYPKIKAIIDQYDELATSINAEQTNKVIHIAIQAHFKQLMLKAITKAAKELGQDYSFRFHSWTEETQKKLITGQLDYSIAVNPPPADEVAKQVILPIKEFLLVARNGHPAFEKAFQLKDYLSYPMVLFNFSQKGLKKHRIEYHADDRGLQCNIAMKLNDMEMAFDYIEKTDSIGWFAGLMVHDQVLKNPSLQIMDVSDYWEKNIMPFSKTEEPSYYLQSNYNAPPKLTRLIFNTLKQEFNEMKQKSNKV